MFDDPSGTIRVGYAWFIPGLNFARNFHLKDCLTGGRSEEDYLSSVLSGDAVSQRETKSGTFLLSFTHEGLKEAIANVCGDSLAIVDNAYDDMLLANLESDDDLGLSSGTANGLARIEEKIADRAFDLFSIGNDRGVCRIVAARHQRYSFGIGMGADQHSSVFDECCHQLRRSSDAGSCAAEYQ